MENSAENVDPIRSLKRLAFMYHAAGNYEKAEELLNIVDQWDSWKDRREGKPKKNRDDRDAA